MEETLPNISLQNFLGVQDLPLEAKSLAKKYTVMLSIHTFILLLTQTYIVLYVIDKVGLAETAFLSSILILQVYSPKWLQTFHMFHHSVLGLKI